VSCDLVSDGGATVAVFERVPASAGLLGFGAYCRGRG
jgi:hypothetical protein